MVLQSKKKGYPQIATNKQPQSDSQRYALAAPALGVRKNKQEAA